jgi:tetratricopeptide (TPR) repeat protein
MTTELKQLNLSPYLSRKPVTLALLTGVAVVFFLAVSALTRLYEAQRQDLADDLAKQGVADLQTQRYRSAVDDFRTALVYKRGNDAYQLSLAQALFGLRRYDEAHAYLVNLWEREPDNGQVSLELARIAVAQGQTEQALRFYHNAIYATWSGDPDEARHKVRRELIAYLMGINARPQAEAELIDLAASVGDNAGEQLQLGQMFARVGDYQRALAAYRKSIQLEPHDAPALAGAGEAAFQLAQYPEAEQYLEEALAIAPGEKQAASQIEDRLTMTESVLHWDPFRPQLNEAERDRQVRAAFAAAGDRLDACKLPNAQEEAYAQDLAKLEPQIRGRDLRDNPDLVHAAMKLVFTIEKETASHCGPQSETDRALLLISSLHEEE